MSNNNFMNSSISKTQQFNKKSNNISSGSLKFGGPMKLGAKKVNITTDKAFNDLEHDSLK